MNNNDFCSQYNDIDLEEWKNKACSICALWMAIKIIKKDFDLNVNELLNEALDIGAWLQSGFWIHNKITILAHNHGIAAYTEEFKSIPFGKETKYSESILNYGVEKIFNFIKNKNGLVIVSVPKDFLYEDKPHSVLFHSVKEENGERYFVYNDSNKQNKEEGSNLIINLKDFTIKWRKLAIFLNKLD